MAGEFKPGDRVRHLKRGKFYEIVGSAQVQAHEDAPLTDYDVVTVYRAEHDGELWVRRTPEFRDGRFEPAPASSPDTPEAGAAGERDGLREAVARTLHERFRARARRSISPVRPGDYAADEWEGLPPSVKNEYLADADAMLPIIDRHTAKALETALGERDKALEETERLKGELFERERLILYWQRDSQNHRGKWIETGNLLLTTESALASEQTAHAETRAKLDEK